MSVIKDPDGTAAWVDTEHRILANAISETASSKASDDGDAYNINTGDIVLTNASESTVLYVKNNEDRDLIITDVIFLIGNSTGGTGDLLAAIFRNPTAGTTVTNANDTEMKSNKNYGSTNVLLADAYKGAQGETLTDGEISFRSRLNGAAKQYGISTGDIILPKGISIGIKITPQSSNTSTTLEVALACYLRSAATAV